jgi:microcompartment protein CcmK/EutM
MIIGEVIGSVIATQKTDNMQGLSLRIVRQLAADRTPTSKYTIAVDVVGAAQGELVLITAGSASRQTQQTDARPVDAIIMAIVDTWQVDQIIQYNKGTAEGIS